MIYMIHVISMILKNWGIFALFWPYNAHKKWVICD
jgi:hypothetical protein